MARMSQHAQDRAYQRGRVTGLGPMRRAVRKAVRTEAIEETAVVTPLPKPVRNWQNGGMRVSHIVAVIENNTVITVKLMTSGQVDRMRAYMRVLS